MILASASGETNSSIAKRYNVSVPRVNHWRSKFFKQGLVGLYGENRPGRPRTHDDEEVMTVLQKVLTERPKNATHWKMRSMEK
jgi:putative transposase